MSNIRQGYVYILHFDEGIAHAQHYVGSTHSLLERLATHQRGSGSALTRELHKRGIQFRIGAVGACSHVCMRMCEKELKARRSANEYCEICNGEDAKKIPNTRPYPLRDVKMPKPAEFSYSIRIVNEDEHENTMLAIKDLMSADRDALGFIPAGGTEGLQQLVKRRKIVVAEVYGSVVGYIAFTTRTTEQGLQANIMQCCVMDQMRGQQIGRRMLEKLEAEVMPVRLKAKVRNDLVSNIFWESCGYTQQGYEIHPTSKSQLNVWIRETDMSNGLTMS